MSEREGGGGGESKTQEAPLTLDSILDTVVSSPSTGGRRQEKPLPPQTPQEASYSKISTVKQEK